jgi:hypothetical protein
MMSRTPEAPEIIERHEALNLFYARVVVAAHQTANFYDWLIHPKGPEMAELVKVGCDAAMRRLDEIRIDTPLEWLGIGREAILRESVNHAVLGMARHALIANGVTDPDEISIQLQVFDGGPREVWTIGACAGSI